MSEHTPGPWSMSRDAVPPGHVQVTVYAEASGQRVATAFEREANARLIAAAPELLDLLKHAKQHLDSYRAYSAEMSKIGRGHVPSGPYSPEYLDGMIKAFFEQVGGV